MCKALQVYFKENTYYHDYSSNYAKYIDLSGVSYTFYTLTGYCFMHKLDLRCGSFFLPANPVYPSQTSTQSASHKNRQTLYVSYNNLSTIYLHTYITKNITYCSDIFCLYK